MNGFEKKFLKYHNIKLFKKYLNLFLKYFYDFRVAKNYNGFDLGLFSLQLSWSYLHTTFTVRSGLEILFKPKQIRNLAQYFKYQQI